MKPGDKKRLLDLFGQLSGSDREALLAFAEFLAGRNPVDAPEAPPAEPLDIPRPEKESVVGAIKRLSATYPMLDKPELLNETSALMTQHVMQGRDAVEVIDEIEVVFSRFYTEWRAERGQVE